MKHKEEHHCTNEYRTGGADFPRHNRLFIAGIAVLAMPLAVLLICCFGLLQADLLSSRNAIGSLSLPALSVSPEHTQPENALYMEGDVVNCKDLGFHCQAISDFCERLYSLPSGIYIVSVAQNTPAARLGVLPGDILISIDGIPLQTPATLQQHLHACPENSPTALEFYRKEKTYTVYFTPGD